MLLWMAWQRQAKQPTTSLNGLTVRQLLDVANTLLGAGASTLTIAEVAPIVAEIIELADQDALDLVRSRQAEQEVLDILDEPEAR